MSVFFISYVEIHIGNNLFWILITPPRSWRFGWMTQYFGKAIYPPSGSTFPPPCLSQPRSLVSLPSLAFIPCDTTYPGFGSRLKTKQGLRERHKKPCKNPEGRRPTSELTAECERVTLTSLLILSFSIFLPCFHPSSYSSEHRLLR